MTSISSSSVINSIDNVPSSSPVSPPVPGMEQVIISLGNTMEQMARQRIIQSPSPELGPASKKRKTEDTLSESSKIPKKFRPTDMFTIGIVTKSDLCASGYLKGYVCPICQDNFPLDSTYLKLRCSHVYHPICAYEVNQHLSVNNQCSLCKTSRFPNPDKLPLLKLSEEDQQHMEYEIKNLDSEMRYRKAIIYSNYISSSKNQQEAEIRKLKEKIHEMGKELSYLESERRLAYEYPNLNPLEETDERDNQAAIQAILRADRREARRVTNLVIETGNDDTGGEDYEPHSVLDYSSDEDSTDEFMRTNWPNVTHESSRSRRISIVRRRL